MQGSVVNFTIAATAGPSTGSCQLAPAVQDAGPWNLTVKHNADRQPGGAGQHAGPSRQLHHVAAHCWAQHRAAASWRQWCRMQGPWNLTVYLGTSMIAGSPFQLKVGPDQLRVCTQSQCLRADAIGAWSAAARLRLWPQAAPSSDHLHGAVSCCGFSVLRSCRTADVTPINLAMYDGPERPMLTCQHIQMRCRCWLQL